MDNNLENYVVERNVAGSQAKIAFSPLPFSKTTSIGILIGAGSLTEEESFVGYSHFLEHMIFKGTQRLNFEELNKEFEKLGAYVNAFTGKYYTLFYVHTLEEFATSCLSLLLEMVFDSTLPKEEIDKEKKVVLEEIASYKDNPEDYLLEAFYAGTFRGSFFAHPILGSPETIKTITKEKLTSYYKTHYSLNNTIISIAGSFKQKELSSIIEEFFQSRTSSQEIPSLPKVEVPFHVSSGIHYKSDLEQSYMCLGFHTHNLSISKQGLKLFNMILGGMTSSRLYMGVREKKALCYGIDSSLYSDPNTGFFNIFASTQHKHLPKLLEAINEEITGFLKNPISEEELFIAKNQIKSKTVFRQESVSQTMLKLASQLFFYNKPLSDIKNLDKMEKVKLSDFEPLYDHLSPQRMSLHTLMSKK